MEEITLKYKNEITIKRDPHGIPLIYASSYEDALFGQGYTEANDRGMQMIFMRIIAQGRISEILNSSMDMLEADIFLRRMDWYGDARDVADSIGDETRELVNAWVAGVNDRFHKGLPFEIRLAGYRYEEWKIEDIIAFSRMISYLGLQQTQGQMQSFIVEMVQNGIEKEFLNEMFPGMLGSLDFSLVRKVKLSERNIPQEILWNSSLPVFTASNVWAISPRKTESGKAILANDLHLDANRLPNMMQEMSLNVLDRYMTGFTMPGAPGILAGRNNNVSWGVAYSFMDSIDSWVEDCKEGKCRRVRKNKTEWIRFSERRELFKRKGKVSKSVVYYENEHGVLDGNPLIPGFYLATRWAGSRGTGAKSIESVLSMFYAKDVFEGRDLLGKMEPSFTWVLADHEGNIGLQMSGVMPDRPNGISGLYPVPGWDPANEWKGFVSPDKLPSVLNPKNGYIAAANNDLNHYGKAKPINLCIGEHRAQRLEDLLSGNDSCNLRQMSEIQFDDYSYHAKEFMSVLRPVLPDSSESEILKSWDCRYRDHSEGAKMFELFYRYLLEEVFGNVFGKKTFDYLMNETRIHIVGYSYFDRILLSPYSLWFGERTREEIYLAAVLRAFHDRPGKEERERTRLPLKNILLGKNPFFFFANKKSLRLKGGRSTLLQLQSYRSEKRDLKLAPVVRYLCDFSEKGIFSNMIGGPLDRPFSPYYNSDTKNWLNARYRHHQP